MAQRRKTLEYVCKPATMVALAAVAVAVDPAHGDRRAWFVAALVLSMLGDVFLMLPRDLFVPGLGSFLLAHVAYTVGLRLHGGSTAGWLAAAAGVLVVDAALARPILRSLRRRQPELVVPVAAYMVVISAMVSSALATAALLAGFGAVLFFASDTLIAWERFVRARPWAPLAIIVTYHLGQAGLTVSLAHG